MISNKPYLLEAFYRWIVDSECTPILVIDATNRSCKIPFEFVEDDEIVFNISTEAVRDFKITNRSIGFKASFSGVIHIISAPIEAILAIYAEENGEGLFLDAEEEVREQANSDYPPKLETVETHGEASIKPKKSKKPFLKLIE